MSKLPGYIGELFTTDIHLFEDGILLKQTKPKNSLEIKLSKEQIEKLKEFTLL